MNRIKAVVIALFAAYWVVVVLLLVAARPIFDQVLDQQMRLSGDHRPAEVATVLVLTALLSLLSSGIVRGWRWTFWLILVVFLAGILRVPTAVLELSGKVSTQTPAWYVGFTAVVGLIQFCIAAAMLLGYRRAGIWGAIRSARD
jgi:hypothetical protein